MWDFITSSWNCLFGSVCIMTSKVKEQFFHRLHYLTPFYFLWFKFQTMSLGLYPIFRIVWYVQREHIGIPLFYFYWILEEQRIDKTWHASISFESLEYQPETPLNKIVDFTKKIVWNWKHIFIVSKIKKYLKKLK